MSPVPRVRRSSIACRRPWPGDIVQVELYANRGPFQGGAVIAGTYPVGKNPTNCGVCLRALGDKGTPDVKEYFGTGGMIKIDAVGGNGQPISATVDMGTMA